MPGEDCVALEPQKLTVALNGGRWTLMEGTRALVSFENGQGLAFRAQALIKQYGFTRHCFVGRPDASFSYWRQ
jgi:hypothetical protein